MSDWTVTYTESEHYTPDHNIINKIIRVIRMIINWQSDQARLDKYCKR
jgi:hypothetical protein